MKQRTKRNRTKKCLVGGNANACTSNFYTYNIDNYKILINSIIEFYLVEPTENFNDDGEINKDDIINYENKENLNDYKNDQIKKIISFDKELKKKILNLIFEITIFYNIFNDNINNDEINKIKIKIINDYYSFILFLLSNLSLLSNTQYNKCILLINKYLINKPYDNNNKMCLTNFVNTFETEKNDKKTRNTKTRNTKTNDNTFYKKILFITKIIKDKDDNYERNQDIMLNFKYLIENKTIDFEKKIIKNLLIQILLGDKKRELLKDKKKEENIL